MPNTPATLPSWASAHLQANLGDATIVNAVPVGSRRILANTSQGAVLVRRSLFGATTHVAVELPRPRIRFACTRCAEPVQSFAAPPQTLRCDGCGAAYVAARDGAITDSLGARVRLGRQTGVAVTTEASTGATSTPTTRSTNGTASITTDGEGADESESATTDGTPTGTSTETGTGTRAGTGTGTGAGTGAGTSADGSEYRPQCSALTGDGAQCRNSARGGSKYCGSHKGYQPPGVRQVAALLDTAPGHEVSGDGLVSVRGRAGALIPGEQCGAVTAAGAQCRNTARSGSKYCPSHRSYQPPTARLVAARRDTAPRVEGAPDTLPTVRRTSRTGRSPGGSR